MKKGSKPKKEKKARKASNPHSQAHRPPQQHRKEKKLRRPKSARNPFSGKALLSKPIEMLKAGVVAALSFFATKQVPQIVLKTRNTSWVGYLANALTALACTAAADRWFGANAGMAAFSGGSMYVFSRVLNDQTDLGARLNLTGCGDPHAVAGMGAIIPAYFTSPVVLDASGNPIVPRAVIDAVKSELPPPALAPAAASAPSGVGRFNRW